jgi:hypothetical protein
VQGEVGFPADDPVHTFEQRFQVRPFVSDVFPTSVVDRSASQGI